MLATIPLNLLRQADRLRPVGEEQVAALMASIGDVGLLNPITVYPRKVIHSGINVDGWGLVAGAHRAEACRRLGFEEIAANVVELSDLERQIAECDENLCASSLSPAERAKFTNRRKEAYEALHPETRNGVIGATARHAPDKLADASFTADTAAKTGKSERTIQRDAQRGDDIEPPALGLVIGTALDTGAFLDKLRQIKPENQVGYVERKLAEATAKKIAPKRPPVAPPKADDDVVAEEVERLRKLWNKTSPEGRDQFLSWLRQEVGTARVAA
jgi:ParB family chromosome partitioning protein